MKNEKENPPLSTSSKDGCDAMRWDVMRFDSTRLDSTRIDLI